MQRFFVIAASLCAALILSLSLPIVFPRLFAPLDHILDDWRIRFVVQPRPESSIVLIDVDERSLAEQGAWPWPRPTLARLLRILIDDYGVSSIAVDMVFPEPRPDEADFALQLKRPQVSGAVVFDLEQRNLAALHLPLPPVSPLQAAMSAPRIFGMPVVANHAGLMPARVGHITPAIDVDGAIRRLPPIICTNLVDCRPSLELTAYASMVDNPRLLLRSGHGLFSAPWELTIQAGDGTPLATLPLLLDGTVIVPYRHARHDWISISATDILRHKANPALLKGVMVLMGGTALGLSDLIRTPLSPVAAGLEPHAEIFSALLDNDFFTVPQWGNWLDLGVLLPFSLLLIWTLHRYNQPIQRAAVFPVWLMLTWLGGAAIAIAALRIGNLLLPLVPLFLFPPVALLLTLTLEFYRAGRDRAGILTLFSAYLPRQVANRLAAFGRLNTALDASRRDITVLFADINGFAGLTEGRTPEIVARLMQRVFSEMAEAVVTHQGTIDKFIGDAIMAFWNAPDDDGAHASHALAAAQDIQRRVAALAPFCAQLGLPPIFIGIGMESGMALVGNFGSLHRRTYTALGEPVVIASRLVGLTKIYNQPVLIGEKCALALELRQLQVLGPAQIRGRVQPVTLYAPDSSIQ